MKRERFGLLKKMKKLEPKTIAKLERERDRLLDGVKENQAKVKAIDKILVESL